MPDNTVVTVYTAGPSCQACTMTKRHLARRGIDFTEVPIGGDDNILDAINELDLSTAPVVCVSDGGGERYWDGYRPDLLDSIGGGR